MGNQEKITPGIEELYREDEKKRYNLILHNDEVNTFDFVINSLIETCEHDIIQAEQCAHITHYKGKCDVKTGEFERLSSMKGELISKGLSVTID
ncbi:MAG: ATP-dependent Clp protease adaptor ClpS [Salinivirgaceae bacterium]|jgi:ATP-dependent Clp protease adaptor protein ClpS|nr:ATP-dependent Clp protease adaptor ClpS [Salinivirgaceae bacterium]